MASSVIKNISVNHIYTSSQIASSEEIDFKNAPYLSKHAYLIFGAQPYQDSSCRYLAIVFAFGEHSILLEIHSDSNISGALSNGILTITVSSKQTNIGVTDLGQFYE